MKPVTAPRFIFLILVSFSTVISAWGDTLDEIRTRGVLLWGGDAEGGAPYTFPDPQNPNRLIGFEVEIAEELASRLGVQQKMVQTPWSTLPQALLRGDFDIILNGLEVTPERQQRVLFTRPYYQFQEALMIRKESQDIDGLEDLVGRRVGTLSGALAQQILEQFPGIDTVLYDDNVSPYRDLALGRLDGVLMDFPIAHYYGEKVPGLKYAGETYGEGQYAIAVRPDDHRLLDTLNALLMEMEGDGSLSRILRRWGLEGDSDVQFQGETSSVLTYLPLLGQAALMTIFLSVVSMLLAVALGLLLCLGRVYGPRPISLLFLAYIELFRGTPLLLQLLVIYFGLPSLGLAFPAWLAGIVGLTLNYAAYEAEIFRGALSSVPGGQMEAALALGLSRRMSIRHVILPQALRVSIPASTNDFIALFKDSSLCSVIGVVELTKQFNILAISTWRVMELGLLTGLLYLMMSYPLSVAARRWERRLARGRRY